MDAYFIYSPFQSLIAVESILSRGADDYSIYLLQNGNKQNLPAQEVLKLFRISHSIITVGSLLDVYKEAKKLKNSFNVCYVGDYFDYRLRIIASYALKHKGKLVYMDDGSSSITVLNHEHPLRTLPFKLRFRFYDPLIRLKRKHIQTAYFTIYNISVKKDISLCDFSYVRSYLKEKQISIQEKTIIIGTNPVLFNSYNDYYLFLEETIKKYVKDESGNVWYCPHRTEAPSKEIDILLNRYGITRHISRYCVEVDLLLNNCYPNCVIGFGSTALSSLKIIYPNADVLCVKFPNSVLLTLKSEGYDGIYEYLKKQGVNILSL